MKRHFLGLILIVGVGGLVSCGDNPTTSPNRTGLYGTQSTYWAPTDTLNVPVNGSVVSSDILASGKTYRLVASGTFTIGGSGDGLGDAEYADFSDQPDSVLDHCGGLSSGVDLGIGINDAFVDSVKTPHWGAFDSTHVYTIDWPGADAALGFNYHDCNYPDNSGSLTVVILTPFEFSVDIKPGSDVNPINLGSKGVIPVAIYGSADLDVLSIDVSSLSFGPNNAPEAHGMVHPEDVNDDGIMDIVLHFRTQACGIVDGTTELCLHATTADSTDLEGCDSITIVPPDKAGDDGGDDGDDGGDD